MKEKDEEEKQRNNSCEIMKKTIDGWIPVTFHLINRINNKIAERKTNEREK